MSGKASGVVWVKQRWILANAHACPNVATVMSVPEGIASICNTAESTRDEERGAGVQSREGNHIAAVYYRSVHLIYILLSLCCLC